MEQITLNEQSEHRAQPTPIAAPTATEIVETPPELTELYTYVKKLGQGAQAKVYEAIRKSDGEHVAIKQLQIDSVQNWKEYDLFWREAEVLQTLNIDGVATFYATHECLDTPKPHAFIVQKCIHGKSLSEMMQTSYRFSIHRIFEIAIQLIDLLEKLHTHNPPVIHRDIKPSNIMFEPQIGDEFKLYLIDFGAVSNPQVQKGGSTVAGTYGYMPPEQLMGRPTTASDIYALGATLTYMLSGVEPGNMQTADFRLIIEPHLERLPHAVVSCLRKMLVPNANERLCDYKILRAQFTNFANNNFIDDDIKAIATSTYENDLDRVEKLGQAGNIDLWLQLPEKTPRDIPSKYYSMKLTGLSQRMIRNYMKQSENEAAHPLWGQNGATLTLVLFIIAFGLSSTLGYYFFLCATAYNSIEFGIGAGICAIVFFALITVFIKHPKLNLVAHHALQKFKQDGLEGDHEEEDEKRRKLIQNGRKTIATVCNIVPIPVDDIFIEKYYPDSEGQLHEFSLTGNTSLAGKTVYFNTRPTSYRISYKFNPPDDASPDDLVHSVTVRYDAQASLHIGDALPILYDINPKDNSDVTSMPFPFPLGKIMSFGEVFDRSHVNG